MHGSKGSTTEEAGIASMFGVAPFHHLSLKAAQMCFTYMPIVMDLWRLAFPAIIAGKHGSISDPGNGKIAVLNANAWNQKQVKSAFAGCALNFA